MSELTTDERDELEACARASPSSSAERAEQVARARRGRRRGAGAGLLARPLAARPQRADGASPAPPSSARRCAIARARRAARQGCSSGAAADERRRLGRHPGQGRRALSRGGARRGARPGAGPRGAGHRLGLDATARWRSRARPAPRCSRSRPATFGHGRTRNLGAERTSGRADRFLTQDATPLPGWLAAFREAFALSERVGAAFGPHLPRPDTSPMIARELIEFFAGFSPDGGPASSARATSRSSPTSTRATGATCWEAIRFDDVPYSEDQAFGRAMLAAGWAKAYHPGAAVLHAHDYPPVGLHAPLLRRVPRAARVLGHVEGFGLRSSGARRARARRRRPALDGGAGHAGGATARAGRRARSSTTAGARSSPRWARARTGSRRASQRAISLEGRASSRDRRAGGRRPSTAPRAGPTCLRRRHRRCATGAAPLLDPCPGWRTRSGCTSPS